MSLQVNSVRPAAVAGTFYPGAADVLAREVDALLAVPRAAETIAPKAIIAPHAGYQYSGPVAASAFAAIAAAAAHVERVVLLGPAHRVALAGVALPAAPIFATPLGDIRIDLDDPALAALPRSEAAHRLEHSLEVELPFLQRILDSFRLIPLVVGKAGAAEVGRVIESLWGGPETLVVVSSDLSHYHPYDRARRIDAETAQLVLDLDVEALTPDRACGAAAVAGLLWVARRKRLRARLLDLRSSGDTAGGRDEVVGYGAFAFYE